MTLGEQGGRVKQEVDPQKPKEENIIIIIIKKIWVNPKELQKKKSSSTSTIKSKKVTGEDI